MVTMFSSSVEEIQANLSAQSDVIRCPEFEDPKQVAFPQTSS